MAARSRTVEDPEWTRRYHSDDPDEKAFGGRVVMTLDDGTVIEDELAVADAHPLRRAPLRARATTSRSSATLADGVVAPAEQERFLTCAAALADLEAGELAGLTVRADPELLALATPRGIFDR